MSSSSDRRERPQVPPPALTCPQCGSDATTTTKHPSKPESVIVDCGSCGHTAVVAFTPSAR
jgi:transcription elongation factor Elf1